MAEVSLKAWGNSLGIRIPAEILKEIQAKKEDIFEINVEEDTIVLKRKFKHRSFEERLADYDGEIHVADFDWGEPVGKELL